MREARVVLERRAGIRGIVVDFEQLAHERIAVTGVRKRFPRADLLLPIESNEAVELCRQQRGIGNEMLVFLFL